MDVEVWKDVVGSNGRYQVSSHGRVVSNIGKRKIMKVRPINRGYLQVGLRFSKKPVFKLVHTLVAEAFIGAKPEGDYQVDHIDEVKTNNNLKNLRYLTRKENRLRSVKSDTLYGVSKIGKRFRSCGRINGITRYLGTFDTEIEAHEAYIRAAGA